jgi:hypothetical protein
MAPTNQDRVGKGLDLLRAGLGPFVERELKRAVHAGALAESRVREITNAPVNRGSSEWDVAVLLRLMWDTWNDAFRDALSHSDRSLVSELREHRNNWAHQEPFSTDDAYRVLDSAHRLLISVSAPQAQEIEALKQEQLRVHFHGQMRVEKRDTAGVYRRVPPRMQGDSVGQIQPLVREVMRVILERNPLPEEEIRNLMDDDYCKREIGLRISNFPLVKESREPVVRYWKDRFARKYYVCSQWWRDYHLHNALTLRDYMRFLMKRYQDDQRDVHLRQLIVELEEFSRRGAASA